MTIIPITTSLTYGNNVLTLSSAARIINAKAGPCLYCTVLRVLYSSVG